MKKQLRQRTPKATAEKIEERIELVESLLAQLAKTSQIKRVMASRYGLGFRQTAEYIARARARLRKRLLPDRMDHRFDSFVFYEGICAAGSKATIRDKIRARQRIDDLLGLNEPFAVAQARQGGAPTIVVSTK